MANQPTIVNRTKRGSSLIEILVTIVIFTVGILAVVQVFPGGLSILRQNRNNTIANALARAELERLKTEVDQMPVNISAASYPVVSGTLREIDIDLRRVPTNITPVATQLTKSGVLSDALGGLGDWELFSGANTTRRIIGEGRKIPAPRFAEGPSGIRYGGVLQLQFAPIEVNTDGFTDPTLFGRPFLVYGNDLLRNIVDDLPNGARPLRQDYVTFVTEDGTEMTLPQGQLKTRRYRITARVQGVNTATSTPEARDLVGLVSIAPAGVGNVRVNVPVTLSAVFTRPNFTVDRVEADTVQASRLFDELPPATPFTDAAAVRATPSILDDAAYEFVALSERLGVLMFNPLGVNYTEQRRQGRLRLSARVDYGVLDWRNLREDFRVPTNVPNQHKLIMNSLKVLGVSTLGGNKFKGLGFQVPLTNAPTSGDTDFLLLDRETGAVILPSGYRVDKSNGLITFIDVVDGDPSNGLAVDVAYQDPGGPVFRRMDDIRNRSFRAIYQANGEFAVQPQKAATRYNVTYSQTLGFAQCYPGQSNGVETVSQTNRLYFTLSEVGKKVIIGDISYRDSGGNIKTMTEQEFLIQAPPVGDPFGFAFIDLREKDPNAVSFDYTRGFAVRTVRGSSVTVRVLWNPTNFQLGADPDDNMRKLGDWLGNMRRVTTESFILKGASE